MQRRSKSNGRARIPRRPGQYHPQLVTLEGRLPLGDALLGPQLATVWLGLALQAILDPAVPLRTESHHAPLVADWWAMQTEATAAAAIDPTAAWVGTTPCVRDAPRLFGEQLAPTLRQAAPQWAPLAALVTTSAAPSSVLRLPGVAANSIAPTLHVPAVQGGAHILAATPVTVSGRGEDALLEALAGRPVADEGEDSGGGKVQSSGTRALFDLGHPGTGPFPSNVFTVLDRTQNTDRRVNLPYPDCKVYVSDCEDLAVLNELDGFNLQPRLSIPFSGPIDVNSVTSSTVFLVSLGSTVPGQGWMPRGTVVGINQIVWDVETNTLQVESDQLLAQHTRFALLVTNSIRDADGDPVEALHEFRRFRQTVPQPYRRELLDAVHEARRLGVRERDLVTASVFTTQSATAVLEKIRDQIHAQTPEPADFLLGPKGERTVFNLDDITDIAFQQQTRDSPPGFTPSVLDLSSLRDIFPGAVGKLAFGKYTSPNYRTPERIIPPVGTRIGVPRVQATEEIYFNLVIPSGQPPTGGWPVAIFGHGGMDNKNAVMLRVAASLSHQGIASLYINAVARGFGPLGTLEVDLVSGKRSVLAAGGRSMDVNGDGSIGANEGANPGRPYTIIGGREAIRQTAVDMMQFVRVLEVGVDVDGDGTADLNPSRLSYFGSSFGGNIGFVLLAVEPHIRSGVLTSPGGSPISAAQHSVTNRPAIGQQLAGRVPSSINAPGITHIEGISVATPQFHDNMPLRNNVSYVVRLADGTTPVIQAPVINNMPGAMGIQHYVENSEWVGVSGDPLGYAAHLRKAPLPGVPAKSVIVQFGKGDQSFSNPGAAALVRAGDLADRATFYRHDLACAENPSIPKNPHMFLTTINTPVWLPVALGAQSQIAAFFASDGQTVIHPEPRRFFEVPIQGPLPEDLGYIP